MDGQMQLSDRIGRRMKLHDLHVLMAVVQAGNMTRAARLLNTTQPAISRSIADLEQTVGVRLLDRSRSGVEPTDYGRALLAGGTAMFDDLRQAVKHIESLVDPTVGEVRVGTHDPMIVGLLPAVFDRLHRTHPGISVHVTQAPTNAQQFDGLRERRIDLLLGRMTPPIDDDIDVQLLFHDRAVVVAGPKSRWAHRSKVEMSELSVGPWCLPLPDTTIGTVVADAFRARGVAFPPKGVLWGGATLMAALIPRGPYLGVFPASLLHFGANLPRLKVVPVELPIPPWSVGAMMLKNRTLTPAVQVFIDCAREIVKPLAGKKQRPAGTKGKS
jgi:DNA-binding transcriptional LysR family regulator